MRRCQYSSSTVVARKSSFSGEIQNLGRSTACRLRRRRPLTGSSNGSTTLSIRQPRRRRQDTRQSLRRYPRRRRASLTTKVRSLHDLLPVYRRPATGRTSSNVTSSQYIHISAFTTIYNGWLGCVVVGSSE